MKRIFVLALISCGLLLSACDDASIGVIGGADGPTSVMVSYENGENVKKPLRMIKVDGKLYYDSGKASEFSPRCGTLDGKLKQVGATHEIPRKNNECNFEGAEGYQNATSITKEVLLNGEWVIFKMFDDSELDMRVFKYCFYLKGKSPNAEKPHEIVVLTENINYDFAEHNKLLSSYQNPNDKKYRTTFRVYGDTDEWGITLYCDDVTPTGLTLQIEQFGGNPSGSLEFGAAYTLETTANDKWQAVETKTGEPLVWNMLAYNIKKNDITEMKIDWQYAYGRLKPGFYCLKKEIMDFRAAGDYDTKTYEVYFTIK